MDYKALSVHRIGIHRKHVIYPNSIKRTCIEKQLLTVSSSRINGVNFSRGFPASLRTFRNAEVSDLRSEIETGP